MPGLVVGLTGALGAGKSTVARVFARHGAVIVDADAVGHAMLAPGGPCFAALVQRFGRNIVGEDGAIVRAALGRRAFGEPGGVDALNAIVHPPLVDELRRQVDDAVRAGRIAVIDAALLLEWGSPVPLDRLIVVTAPEAERVARAGQRMGLTQDETRDRLAAQMSEDDKVRRADVLIENTGSLGDLEAKAEAAWADLARMNGV